MTEFFLGFLLPLGMGSTLIAVILKITSPQRFSDFRPISLVNFVSKVATRILASRLQPLMLKIISSEQGFFFSQAGIFRTML